MLWTGFTHVLEDESKEVPDGQDVAPAVTPYGLYTPPPEAALYKTGLWPEGYEVAGKDCPDDGRCIDKLLAAPDAQELPES